jgi:elongation factor 1-alpha
MGKEKIHINLVVIGHVDSGKSTTTGHLIYKMGGIDKRTIEKYEKEAKEMGKASFKYAWVLDKLKAERERGITIDIALWKFETKKYYFTIIDAPGHRDFIKNMISGAAQADVALLMVPADGNFTTAVQKGDHKQGVIQGQTRQHARLINLLGVKTIIVGVNKMDSDTAGYSQARYTEVADEMKNMLGKVGWKPDFVTGSVPIIPISGLQGDNLLKPSTNMTWWTGQTVKNIRGEEIKVVTLLDALNNFVSPPPREEAKPLRVPISGIYKIKGVGDVLAGRVEQGVVEPNKEVLFLPTHTAANSCTGKVFSLEMHHKRVEKAFPGDNVGMNIKGLRKENMPRSGDVMIIKGDATLGPCKTFKAAVQTLDIPKEIKVGYAPIGFVRCGHSACKLTKIDWKRGKETGGAQADNPANLKTNDLAQCEFEPLHPLVVDTFKNCEGLSRIAFLDGNTAVMLGKITEVVRKE